MAYRDFQHFLDVLESKDELKRIQEPVSPYLEITEIADRVMKSGGKALLFENVVGAPHRLGSPDPESAIQGKPSIHPLADPKWGAAAGLAGALRSRGQLSKQQTGRQKAFTEEIDIKYGFPVAINTMGTRYRMSLALGVEDFEEHGPPFAGAS